jgi:quinol---cytochrome c reductase cytochrome c subunit, bacillus type
MPDGPSEERYRLLGVVPREVQTRPEQEPDDTVFTWPHLLVRHVVVAAGTVAVVFALAIAFDAPLKDMANPNLTPPVAKAPWYFAGLQELLSHVHPMVAGILVPGVALLFLAALPFLDRSKGWRLRDRKYVVIVFAVIAVAALVLTLVGARVVVVVAVEPPVPGAVTCRPTHPTPAAPTTRPPRDPTAATTRSTGGGS